jgi:hypothetical protein
VRYFVNDTGGWLTVSGDAELFTVIPPGYREVTEAEYNEAAGTITIPLPEAEPAER